MLAIHQMAEPIIHQLDIALIAAPRSELIASSWFSVRKEPTRYMAIFQVIMKEDSSSLTNICAPVSFTGSVMLAQMSVVEYPHFIDSMRLMYSI